MTRPRLLTAVIAAGACAVIGVVVGISSSAAATTHPASKGVREGGFWPHYGGEGATGGTGAQGPRLGGFGARGGVIHSVTVVSNSSGGFDTVTIDSGTLKTIVGDILTITEGTKSATYATPTVTVPSSATVVLDGKASDLKALVGGDRVTITQNSDGTTTVFATDSSFSPGLGNGPAMGGGFGRWRHGGPFAGGPIGASGATGSWRRGGSPRAPLFGGPTQAPGTIGT